MNRATTFTTLTMTLAIAAIAATTTGCSRMSGKSKPAGLTEASVQAFVDAGRQALARRDVDATCAQFDEQVRITIVETNMSGPKIQRLDKPGYCRLLRQVYGALPANVQLEGRFQVESLTIDPDGKRAELSGRSLEVWTVSGQVVARASASFSGTLIHAAGSPRYEEVTMRVAGGQ